ncbi:MAG: hypothetical protein WCZ12_03830, partial [Patescibacteria group bacterium]
MNYLKIAKATELSGRDRTKYRLLEMLPGFLSVGTLLILIVFSFVKPVWVAYFLIAFNVYYVLLVVFLAIYLITSYLKFRENKKIDWLKKCEEMGLKKDSLPESCLYLKGTNWKDLIHLIILPTYNEDLGIIKTCFQGLVDNKYPLDKMIVVLAIEER